MRCSVVIPCHGGVDLTRACIESLVQQDERPAEIVLVDNASPDTTATLDGLHGVVRVVKLPTNRGFAGGVNAGIAAARGDTVLVLNNDTQAATNLLAELHAVLATDPAIAAVAPVSNHVKGPAMLPVGARGKDPVARARMAAELAGEPVRLQDVDTLAGLCLLVRRATFAMAGAFDERFGHGNFEDDDFCLRLRLQGHRLVVARRAFLHHEGHATFRSLGLEIGAEIRRRRAQFVAKWRHDPAGRAVIAALAGDVAGAAGAAHEAAAAWPKWPDSDWHAARWFRANGDHGGAAARFGAILRTCPAHSDAAVELTCSLLAAGDRSGAERTATTTLRRCHLPTTHALRVATAFGEDDYRRGEFAGARRRFAAARELAPDDGALHNWIGSCDLATGDLAGAEAAFAAAVAAGFALAHTNLGIVFARRGDRRRARASFARAVEESPGDPVARQNLEAIERAVPV